MKTILIGVGICLVILGTVLIHRSYKNYTNPSHVYGNWVELNVLKQDQDMYTFSRQGVLRNHHLIATTYEYDGTKVSFNSGESVFVYQLAGTAKLPQLKRISPSIPPQILIRENDESTFDGDDNQPKQKTKSLSSF